jgi:hypothetical protein
LPVGAGQALESLVVNELVDVGLAVGAGFIDGAVGAEIQDGVHKGVPFGSIVVLRAVTRVIHVAVGTTLDNEVNTLAVEVYAVIR